MATVSSLVCWGGRTGKTVSLSASTDLVTLTNHGLRNGAKLWPSGTLPAELSSATPVYARSVSANTFSLHSTSAGAIAGTDKILFAGTSTYAAVILRSDLVASPSTALAPYGLSDLTRWGDSGAERIYDGLMAWNTARGASNTGFFSELCEIGDAFSDTVGTSPITLKPGPSPSTLITPTINGVTTAAFHGGVFGSGYSFAGYQISLGNYVTVEGITLKANTPTQYGGVVNLSNALLANIFRCFIYGGNASNSYGITTNSETIKCHVNSNVILSVKDGLVNNGCTQSIFANNIVAKCTNGFVNSGSSTGYRHGYWYNNIAIGNTVNWGLEPGSLEGAGYNIGASGNTAWGSATGTNKVVTTSDFIDYENNDFRPALLGSPQVDSGAAYYGAPDRDIANAEVPNYNNGGPEAVDIGCYEFDHGYGNHPASTTVTFYGVVAGSEIHVYDSEDNELVGTESCTANQSLTWGIPTNPNVKITIIKRGLRWMKFTYLSEEGPQMIPIFPQPDLGYNNPA